MVIITTKEEQERIKNGEITYDELVKEREGKPEPIPISNKYDGLVAQLRLKNTEYKELIILNRELRNKVVESTNAKRKIRDEIELLRKQKKELKKEMGI